MKPEMNDITLILKDLNDRVAALEYAAAGENGNGICKDFSHRGGVKIHLLMKALAQASGCATASTCASCSCSMPLIRRDGGPTARAAKRRLLKFVMQSSRLQVSQRVTSERKSAGPTARKTGIRWWRTSTSPCATINTR